MPSYERQKRLFEQKLISEQQFTEAEHDLEQLEISLADARRAWGYTEVRAPIAGTVDGARVKPATRSTIGPDLFDIVDFGSIVARVYVPEKRARPRRVPAKRCASSRRRRPASSSPAPSTASRRSSTRRAARSR